MIIPYNPLTQLELKKKQEETKMKIISPKDLEKVHRYLFGYLINFLR
mgnify:CR=1 FL=1